MKKKLLGVFLVVSMLISLVVVPASAYYGDIDRVLYYEVNNGEVLITECDSSASGAITIPDEIEGYPVTNIGSGAFAGCSSLTEITIPDSVISIGGGAFSDCSSLTEITIPDGVTSIGYGTFEYCRSLAEITIPNSVTSIGTSAFEACNSLAEITIPDSVASIGEYAFQYCSSLTTINVDSNNQNYSSQDGVLFNKKKTEIIRYPGGKTGAYTIPDSVTYIHGSAFYGCGSLTSVTIPNSIKSISNNAFLGSSLTTITIPNSVKYINSNAFNYCSSLKDVYYGGTETDWGNVSIDAGNYPLKNATIHYNCIYANKIDEKTDYNGETVVLPEGTIFDIGVNLNFLHGFINAEKGEIKSGDKKITGKNIYFDEKGQIRLQDGETAKIVRENANGSTSQGFLLGKENATGALTLFFDLIGTANGKDYTGRTITKTFNFDKIETEGLINVAFTINNVPKGLTINIREE